ncbi:hypothetical protein [Leucobacter luti]|uniref:hypothetical protein n=1 Tax=Leucobacter luti TaxID=340320 RepID=UPI0037C14AF6
MVGIAGTVDFALFYTSGQVMDRFGRLWAALPATIGMAVAFLGLSLTHDSPDALTWLLICAVVIGIGNGLSSGIVLTLGADLAPQGSVGLPRGLAHPRRLRWRDGPARDLGNRRCSLPLAAAAAGTLAVLGAAGFARWVP